MIALYFGVLIVPALITGWVAAGKITWNTKTSHRRLPEADDYAFGLFVGTICGLLWPVVAPSYLIYKWFGRLGVGKHRLLYVPREHRASVAPPQPRQEVLDRGGSVSELDSGMF